MSVFLRLSGYPECVFPFLCTSERKIRVLKAGGSEKRKHLEFIGNIFNSVLGSPGVPGGQGACCSALTRQSRRVYAEAAGQNVVRRHEGWTKLAQGPVSGWSRTVDLNGIGKELEQGILSPGNMWHHLKHVRSS